MRNITVYVKKIEVVDFSPKDKSVTFDLYFNTYKVTKTIVQPNPETFAEEILKEIRKKLKQKYQTSWGDSVTEGLVNVMIHDEDETEKRLTFFFSKLNDRIDAVKTTKDPTGYMNKINQVKGMKGIITDKSEDDFISEV